MSPPKRHSSTLAGLTLLSAAAFSTTSALATMPLPPPKSVAISFVRTDLARPTSVQDLYERIKLAARSVCREYDPHDLSRLALYRHCYETAVDNAVAQVDATALTALHRSRTQHSAAS